MPPAGADLSFGVLLNLAGACNSEDPEVLWGFVGRYADGATPENSPFLDRLVGHAIAYYRDFVKPSKQYRAPDEKERAALNDLADRFAAMPADATAEAMQNEVYAVGKDHDSSRYVTGSGRCMKFYLAKVRGRASARSRRFMAGMRLLIYCVARSPARI